MKWLEILESQVQVLGRRQVEIDIAISKTTLSQVLNGKYPGNMENVEKKVLNAYTDIRVICPVLGEINSKRCQVEQIKPFNPSNPQRVQLYKACRNCPNRMKP
ncbi:MAG: hypothetical protein Alis3KO_00650 [Aliiglaciecola sp.]